MSSLYHAPRAEAQDSAGGVLAGAKKFFYETGTSTPLDTFTTEALTTANANPVVADSAGRWAAIWLKDQDYREVLKDSDDVVIWDHDPIRGGGDSGALDNTIRSTLATTGGANAYALTVNTTFSALTNGQTFTAKASFTNTGPATLTITPAGGSPLSAVSILKHHDLELADGDIENGQWFTVKYDGANLQLLTPLATIPIALTNLLINGDFRIAQRGTTFDAGTTPANNDDTVLLDRGILLSDGNDVVDVSQETSVVPVGSYAALKFDVETADKKFGYLQIIEGKDAEALIGGVCSLSFQARRTGTSIANLRAAVIAWDSTVDAVTSDVVSAWGGAGTNPTLVANWTFENTPASLAALTTGFQTFKIENISIDTSGATNVAVFIWIDDVTTTVGDFIYITDVQLVPGPNATPFQRRLHAAEAALAKWFYRTFDVFVPSAGEERSMLIDMRSVPTIAGGGAGFSSTGTTADTLIFEQTTGAVQTLTLESEL